MLNAILNNLLARLKAKNTKSNHRVRTPTVLQMEAVECGAASLAIILAYFGRYVPLEELRISCGVSRDGSKASNVVKAAREYGLSAQGKRLAIEELLQQKLPFVVFWNFNHFLVVEGFADGIVYLNDPASGPRKVTDEEFSKAYTGVTLVFETTTEFKRKGEQRNLLKSLLPRLKGSKSAFSFVILASLALVIPGLVVPVFTQVFVDNYLVGRMDDWVKPLLFGMVVTALLRTGLTWLQQSQLLRMEMRLALTASSIFFWHVLRLPVEFFNQRYAGDISQRVASNDRIAQILSGDLATNAVNVVALIFYVAIMLQYDWVLTLIGILITAINLVTLKYISRLRKDGNLKLLQDRGKLMATTMGGIQTIETIKATGGETDFFMRWSGYKAKVNNTEQHLELYTRLLAVLPSLLNTLVTVAILGLGGARVIAGDLTVGMLVAFQSLMVSFTQPVTNLMGLAGKLQEAEGDLTRLDDVLNYPIEERFRTQPESNEAMRQMQGYLELCNLTFGYSRLEPALIKNFNLKLEPGQRVALVGGSGSGKSTVSKLVMGIHQPWSGQVLFDGNPREQVATMILNATLAGVDQEVYLFEGSIRDNITLWDETLPESDMVQAAKDACIHEMIASRTGGYDSRVNEGGTNFSGGQGQRLEIARALAINPRIIVMDEATAALDTVTEKIIDDHIRRRGCACLIVAHRLSTIRDCDEIIVMDKGKVVERGNHDQLMATSGLYYHLINATV
jgi:NHLM bacteriocin system ABC transporter peptidase/ATP-binding protein